MVEKLNVNKRNFGAVSATLKKLDMAYLNQMMKLQKKVVEGLEDSTLYVPFDKTEIENHFNGNSEVIGIVTGENELIALGIYVEAGETKKNYGYDFGLEGKELLKIGQVDTTIVDECYRGNGLQRIMCEELEGTCRERGKKILCATVSPYNKYSVETFLKLGYEIKADKLKYGGLRRYVLAKVIG